MDISRFPLSKHMLGVLGVLLLFVSCKKETACTELYKRLDMFIYDYEITYLEWDILKAHTRDHAKALKDAGCYYPKDKELERYIRTYFQEKSGDSHYQGRGIRIQYELERTYDN